MTSPVLQRLSSPLLSSKQLELTVLRLDSIHPEIQGNKWFKLQHNLAHAQQIKCNKIISFGGAYSNHLYALAAAGSALGLKTVGVVRGEIVEPLNPVIRFLKARGMELIPVSRSDYRRKEDPDFLQSLLDDHGPAFVIPEGGSNELGARGCEDIAGLIASALPQDSHAVTALACGTGTTMAGIVDGFAELGARGSVLGLSVLKAPGFIGESVRESLRHAKLGALSWSVNDTYHCGGYAKKTPELLRFMDDFQAQHGLPLEHVYTGKLFFALDSMIRQDSFAPDTHICAVHTGGIVSL